MEYGNALVLVDLNFCAVVSCPLIIPLQRFAFGLLSYGFLSNLSVLVLLRARQTLILSIPVSTDLKIFMPIFSLTLNMILSIKQYLPISHTCHTRPIWYHLLSSRSWNRSVHRTHRKSYWHSYRSNSCIKIGIVEFLLWIWFFYGFSLNCTAC